jgi:hypothetical protein
MNEKENSRRKANPFPEFDYLYARIKTSKQAERRKAKSLLETDLEDVEFQEESEESTYFEAQYNSDASVSDDEVFQY